MHDAKVGVAMPAERVAVRTNADNTRDPEADFLIRTSLVLEKWSRRPGASLEIPQCRPVGVRHASP